MWRWLIEVLEADVRAAVRTAGHGIQVWALLIVEGISHLLLQRPEFDGVRVEASWILKQAMLLTLLAGWTVMLSELTVSGVEEVARRIPPGAGKITKLSMALVAAGMTWFLWNMPQTATHGPVRADGPARETAKPVALETSEPKAAAKPQEGDKSYDIAHLLPERVRGKPGRSAVSLPQRLPGKSGRSTVKCPVESARVKLIFRVPVKEDSDYYSILDGGAQQRLQYQSDGVLDQVAKLNCGLRKEHRLVVYRVARDGRTHAVITYLFDTIYED